MNFCKIGKIYGINTLEEIKENIESVMKNIEYLKKLNFNDAEDIFERFPLIFILNTKTFKKKVDNLIHNLGSEYVEILETNMELWEEIEW